MRAVLLLFLSCATILCEPAFTRLVLNDQYFCDGISAGDFNRDGHVDIVAGPFWYEGPAFRQRHAFYPAKVFETAHSPTDSMFSYVYDFNQDGWLDILVFGRVHLHEAFWYENPRNARGHWKKHLVFHRIQGESPPFMDVDGDGKPEIVAHWENRWGLIQPDPQDPTKPWRFKPITDEGKWHHFYHGEGIGDVNGDGRNDLILNEGWYEQPSDPATLWIRHEFRFGEKGGAQMFAYDVDGDGDNDIISALDAHGWGLAWFEQLREQDGITFRRHMIMGSREEEAKYGVAFSQPHALALADINGDGRLDIVTGKRRWAHGPAGDVEPNAAPVNYWFELVRNGNSKVLRFVPHLIDVESGLGVQIAVIDINSDGRPDVLTASKLGAFAFFNQLSQSRSPTRSEAMIFPAKNWIEATPESQGVDSGSLESAINFLKTNSGSDGVRELVVVRNGRLIWKGDNIDHRHGVWSCTKSFTSTILGLLMADGKCNLDSRGAEFVVELEASYPEVMLRHFATMTSGYRAIGDEPRGSYKHGPSNTPFEPSPAPLFRPPGSEYAYWDSAMNMFGLVLTRIAGESLESLFKRRIGDPIGMDPAAWDWGNYATNRGVVVNGGSGNGNRHIFITARELARFGHLFLNEGNWDGKQLIDRNWVREATRVHVAAGLPWAHPESDIDARGCYGLNWWVNGIKSDGTRLWPGAPLGTFAAVGHNNNRMVVIPEWGVVIVRLGLDQSDKKITDQVLSEFISRVGKAIQQGSSTERKKDT